MTRLTAQTVTRLADLTDPTPGGVLTSIATFCLAAMMVLAIPLAGWFAFKVWHGSEGGKDTTVGLRTVGVSFLALEAFLGGGVMFLASQGADFMPGLPW